MLSFEIKKFLKSRKVIFILVFSLLISVYALLIDKNYKVLFDEDSEHGAYFDIDAFLNEPATDELRMELFTRLNPDNKGPSDDLRENYKEQLLKLNRFMDFLKEKSKIYPEIFSEKNQERIDNFKWQIFKYENIIKNNSYDQYDSFSKEETYASSLIRKNSIFFSSFVYVFFIVFFSDAFSKEREDETINLLYSQPYKSRDLAISKFINIILSILIYIFATLLFSYIILKFKNVPFDGFKDFYRIIGTSNWKEYYTGSSLILNSLLSFFMMAIFWSSLSMFISSRFKSQTSLSIMLIIFGLLLSLSPNFTFLRTFINPIYAGETVNRLLGEWIVGVSEFGANSMIFLPSVKAAHYLLFLVLSLIFLVLSFYAPYEIESFDSKEKKSVFGLYNFESAKIRSNSSFYIYLLGALVLFSSLFASQYKLDNNVKKETFGKDSNFVQRAYINPIEDAKFNIERIEKSLSEIPDNEPEERPVGPPSSAPRTDNTDKANLENELAYYTSELEALNLKAEGVKKLGDYYEKKDYVNYYTVLSEYFRDNWDYYMAGYLNIKHKPLVNTSKYNEELFKEMIDKKVDPILIINPFYSLLDDYLTDEYRVELGRDIPTWSHSGPMYLFKILYAKNLDLILLVIVSLAILGGYSYDWDRGRQIELMYTSSYSRNKLHNHKIISQFINSILALLFMVFFIFLLGFIFGGIEGYNFPVAKFFGDQYEFIPLWLYLIKTIVAIVCFILMLTCMVNAFSIYIKNKTILLAFSFGIISLATFISDKLPNSIRGFIPFTYIELDTLADQSIQIFKGLLGISYGQGIVVMLLWSVFFYLVGLLLLKSKKDVI